MKHFIVSASIALALGLGLTLAMLWLLLALGPGIPTPGLQTARAAAGDVYCVTPGGGTYAECDQVFTNVQAAVDAATGGEEIRVATGIYTDVQARTGITQVVYISKTVTLRGGYTAAFTDSPDPVANPTTLDAQGQGRVLYITGDISPTIEGLHITSGNAAGLGGSPSGDSGGGVLVISATITASNNRVFSNTATFGGGLYFYSSANATLTSNVINNNRGRTHAGGLYFRYSPGATLIDNTISNNKVGPGGGQQFFGGVRFDHSNNATLIDNTISGNHADNQCGGLCFDASGNALLIGNVVISNSAGFPGFASNAGGLRFVSSNGANLIRNTVINNSTLGNGGGLYLERSNITMTNNVVTDNQLTSTGNFTGSGSGLYIAGSSPRLLHTTIARNGGGDGSGVYVTDIFGSFSTVALTNTILVSHTVGITVTAGNTATLNGVLWDSNTANTGGEGAITVTNEYTGDPAFAADGYHLTDASAAIDKGLNAGVDDDIDGVPRPQGDGYDLGADEFGFPTYLPLILKNSG